MYKSLIMLVLSLGAVYTLTVACNTPSVESKPAVAQRASPPIPPAAAVTSNPSSPTESTPAQVIDGTVLSVDMSDNAGRGPFAYMPVDFTFEVGEVVNFTLTSESQFHTFTVIDLGIDEGVDGGDSVDFNFTFDKQGTYALVCIPHEALGMVGTITVR